MKEFREEQTPDRQMMSQLVQMRFTRGPADPDIIKILIVHDSLAGIVQLFSEEKSEIGHPSTL